MTAKRGPKTPGVEGILRRRTVLVDDLAVTMLDAVGGGNLSRGVRLAARVAYDRYQLTPDTPTDGPGAPGAPLARPPRP